MEIHKTNIGNKFDNWVKSYTKDLLTWAKYKTSDNEVAEDLVQETFLIAFQKIDTFEETSQPKTWLFGILNYKILEYYKTKLKENKNNYQPNEILDQLFQKDGHWDKLNSPKPMDMDEKLFLFESRYYVELYSPEQSKVDDLIEKILKSKSSFL